MSKALRERQKNRQEKKAFFEQKWFRLTFILCLFGWLFYESFDSFQIDKHDLVPITVTVKGETSSGGRHNPVKLYFNTKEYTNEFGMYIGGPIDRWTEVKEALTENQQVEVKIFASDTNYFNSHEVIKVYYLKGKNGIVFDEDDFNEGEKRYDSRWFIVLLVLLVVLLYGYSKD